MAKFDDIIEQKIREAMQAGKFNNLRGSGKPLKLEPENPYVPEGWGMAFDVLKNQGFTLPWIEESQEIEKDYQSALRRLSQAKAETGGEGSRWQAELNVFEAALDALNRRILDYNLRAPADVFKRSPYILRLALRSIQDQGE